MQNDNDSKIVSFIWSTSASEQMDNTLGFQQVETFHHCSTPKKIYQHEINEKKLTDRKMLTTREEETSLKSLFLSGKLRQLFQRIKQRKNKQFDSMRSDTSGESLTSEGSSATSSDDSGIVTGFHRKSTRKSWRKSFGTRTFSADNILDSFTPKNQRRQNGQALNEVSQPNKINYATNTRLPTSVSFSWDDTADIYFMPLERALVPSPPTRVCGCDCKHGICQDITLITPPIAESRGRLFGIVGNVSFYMEAL